MMVRILILWGIRCKMGMYLLLYYLCKGFGRSRDSPQESFRLLVVIFSIFIVILFHSMRWNHSFIQRYFTSSYYIYFYFLIYNYCEILFRINYCEILEFRGNLDFGCEEKKDSCLHYKYINNKGIQWRENNCRPHKTAGIDSYNRNWNRNVHEMIGSNK